MIESEPVVSAHPAQMLPGGRPPAPAPTPEADRGRGAAAGGDEEGMMHGNLTEATELPPTLDELIKRFADAGTLSQQDIYRLIAIASGATDALAGANLIIGAAETYRIQSTNYFASGISEEERERRARIVTETRAALFKLLSDRWFGLNRGPA